MTITTNPSRNEYTATASQTVFNYTYKIYAATDLNVYVTPAGQDANDSTDLTVAYVVDVATIENPAGGFLTFNTGVAAGDLVTIVSDIPENRTVDYQNNGDFRPEVVNNDIDRTVSLVKQVSSRVPTFPESLQGVDAQLPTPTNNELLAWDGVSGSIKSKTIGAGPGIAVGDDGKTITVSSIGDGSGLDDNVFSNLAIALAASGNIGDFITTYEYNAGTGEGSGTYQIVAGGTGSDDGGSFIDKANGDQLQLIPKEGIVYGAQWGMVADGTGAGGTDNSPMINAAIDFAKTNRDTSRTVILPPGLFSLESPIIYLQSVNLFGAGVSGGQFGGTELICNFSASTISNPPTDNYTDRLGDVIDELLKLIKVYQVDTQRYCKAVEDRAIDQAVCKQILEESLSSKIIKHEIEHKKAG